MNQMNEEALANAMSWMRAHLEKETFGEIGFTVTVHQGAIRKIAYQLTEKKATPPESETKRTPTVAPKSQETGPVNEPGGKKRLIRQEELSEVLGLHRVTLTRYVAARRIPFIKIGGAVRFDLDAVLASLKDPQT